MNLGISLVDSCNVQFTHLRMNCVEMTSTTWRTCKVERSRCSLTDVVLLNDVKPLLIIVALYLFVLEQ